MSPIDVDREWETWRAWLGAEPQRQTIYAEIVEMIAFRKIWRGFAHIYESAPDQARKMQRSSGGFDGTTPARWARLSDGRQT
jgi:hypothetical protein